MDDNRRNPVKYKKRTTFHYSGDDANNERQIRENASHKVADRRRRKRLRRAKHKDCRAKHKDCRPKCTELGCPESSKAPITHHRDQQLRMQMCNETSPSKPSTSGVRQSPVRTAWKETGAASSDDDISIHTDEDSDGSGGFVNLSRKKCTATMKEVCSSTPIAKVKKMLSRKKGIGRARKSKQLRRRKAKNRSLNRSRSRSATSKHRQTKRGDGDSEWESATETEMSGMRRKLQNVSANDLVGQDMMTSDGRLFIDVDEDAEEIAEHQIPMKHQLERTIASGCAKNNLSPSLVKKILRSLVTHDLVKEMLRTTLKDAEEDSSQGGIVYEPKLTRSKMKEVLEKGKDPKLWPVSPVKLGQPAQAGPSILDVEFTDEEDEEDDEYEPSREAEDAESDEDSVISSQVSEVGSPFPFSSPPPGTPSTPLPPAPATPTRVHTPTPTSTTSIISTSASLNRKAAQSESVTGPMGPPPAPPRSVHSTKQRLVFLSPEKSAEETEEDGIARRTRSKLPLTTTSLYDIEEAFVAPDITADMYDTMCDDSDWQEFLRSLHKSGATDTQNESMEVGEEDDPEFNYIAEAETEEIEAEEVRFDGPFRVTRKELNSLMEELEDLFNEDDYSMIGLRTNLASAHENAALLSKKPSADAEANEGLQSSQPPRRPKSSGKEARIENIMAVVTEPKPVAPMILDQQIRQVKEQMRKHVQLTTQMYVLAQGSDDFHPMADGCRTILKELDHLRTASAAGSHSAYNACNLSGALEIVDNDIDWASHRSKQKVVEAAACDSPAQMLASASSVSVQSARSAETLPSSIRSTCSVQTSPSSTQSANSIQTSVSPSSTQSASSVQTLLSPSSAQSASSTQTLPSSAQAGRCVTRSRANKPSSECGNSSKALASGSGRQVTSGATSNHRMRKRCAADSASKVTDGDNAREERKRNSGNTGRFRMPLLEIQKDVICRSAVFLYPALLPLSGLGLIPLAAIRRSISKVCFNKWEETLLVMGKEQFKDMKGVYQLIHQHMIPSKTPQQLRCHFYNSGKKMKDKSIIWRYRQTGEVPSTPQDVEEFSADMIKAPCDQPSSCLPAWCKGYRIHVNAAKRKQETDEKSRQVKEERERKAAQRMMEQCKKRDEAARQAEIQQAAREQRRHSSCRHRRVESEDSSSESESEEETESEFDSESEWSSDSSYRPPPKRHQRAIQERQNQPDAELLTPSGKPISILSSVRSSPSDKPSVIVTSKGVYVPIHLADPSKVNGVLADAHFTVVSDSGKQRVITTEQLLRSTSADSGEGLPDVSPSSLVDRCAALHSSGQSSQCFERSAQGVEQIAQNVERRTENEQQSGISALNKMAASNNDVVNNSLGQAQLVEECPEQHGGCVDSFSEQMTVNTDEMDKGLADETGPADGEACPSDLTPLTKSPTAKCLELAEMSSEHRHQHAQASALDSELSRRAAPALSSDGSNSEQVRTGFRGQNVNASDRSQTRNSQVINNHHLLHCESSKSVCEQLTSDAQHCCQERNLERLDSDSHSEHSELDQAVEVRAEAVNSGDVGHVNGDDLNQNLQETPHRGMHLQTVNRNEQPEPLTIFKQNEVIQYCLTCPETNAKNLPEEILESQTTSAVHRRLCTKRIHLDLREESHFGSKESDFFIIQSDQCTSTVSTSREKQLNEPEREGSKNTNQQNPGGLNTSGGHDSKEKETTPLHDCLPGSIPDHSHSNKSKHAYRFHVDAGSEKLDQTTLDVSTARESSQNAWLSPQDNPIIQFDILHTAMKRILGTPAKGSSQAVPGIQDGESLGCGKARIPKISLNALPSIVNTAPGVNITVNMVYRSDYAQGKPSAEEDSAEDPSSTTPDGELGETSGQREASSSHREASGQRETGTQGECQVSDDAVSTTSDIGESSEPVNVVHEQESEFTENAGRERDLCEPSSGRDENSGSSDVSCGPTSETGHSSRQGHVSSSPASEHREGPSGRRLPFSEPASQPGGGSIPGSHLSDLSHEGLCNVSSSSPIRSQTTPDMQNEPGHSDETVQCHLTGYETFFKVTSSGSQQGSPEPSNSEDFSTQTRRHRRLPSAGCETDEPMSSQDIDPQAENRELLSHDGDGGHTFGPPLFTGADSQAPAADSVQVQDENPQSPGAAPPSSGDGSTQSGPTRTDSSSAAVPHKSRTSTVPHTSWSGLSSVCSSGIVISVTMPDSEETSDTTMSATEEDADSSGCVRNSVSTSDQGLDTDVSASEGSPPSRRFCVAADHVTVSEIPGPESATSTGHAFDPQNDHSPDASPHQVSRDQRISLSVPSPVSFSSDRPLAGEDGSAFPAVVNLRRAPGDSVAEAAPVDVGCSLAHHKSSAVETADDAARDSSEVGGSDQGGTETRRSPTSAGTTREGEAGETVDSDEQSKRQALLKALKAAAVSNQPTGSRGDFLQNLGAGDGVAEVTVQPAACREEEEENEGVIPSHVPGAATPANEAAKLLDMQAENERSPPPRYAQDPEEQMQASSFDSPAPFQPSLPASVPSRPAPQQCVSPENPGTPMVLSCLGLVSATNPAAKASLPSVQQSTGAASPSAVSTKVIATLTPVLRGSPSESPTTAYTLRMQRSQEKTPTKSPSASLPVLAPKPGPVSYPSPPYLPRRKHSSPKKQQLQKQVRAILPRGYTYEMKLTSPTKAAARTLKRKATLFCQRSPNKPLLPKDPATVQSDQTRPMTRGQSSALPSSSTFTHPPWNRRGARLRNRSTKKEAAATTAEKSAAPQQKGNEEGSQEESDETGSEVEDVAMLSQEDSQNEEEAGELEDDGAYLNDLIAASTTIGFNPYKKFPADKDGLRTRKEIRREQRLTLLASDVVETDPRKDDRDTAYAQAYLNKVKVAMQKDPNTYLQFMDLLRQFEINELSPVEAYESLSGLLANYPELMEDFAGFLLPCQALQTGCHLPNQLIQDVRIFLRKLELHFDKAELKYQKILRTLSKWDFKAKSPEQLRETVMPLLRSVPQHLHDDFVRFFPELRPSESHMEREDFEDIRLGDSDGDGNNSPDDFEDIKYAEENDPYRTKRCPCPCHQEMITKRNREGIRHCYNCCLKVVGGQLYFQPSNVTTRRPVSATFHDPVLMPLPPDLPPPSARSRGAFHRSAILDEPDDDNDEDVDDEIEEEEEEAKVAMEEETVPQGERLETEEGMEEELEEGVHQSEEEEGETEEAAEDVFEELGGPSPAKHPRTSSMEDAFPPLAVRSSTCSVVEVLQPRTLQSKGPSLEEALQQPLGRQPTSPMQQPVQSLAVQPPSPGLQHNRLLMRGPGGSNLRMRKRLLSMRPGCQPGGTLSVVGPDNTVIMFNSSLPAPALGETLPGLHEQRTFYPLSTEQRGAAAREARIGGSDRASYESCEHEEENPALPTITSPSNNIQRGSFAGLLQRAQPTTTTAVSEGARLSALPEQSMMGEGATARATSSPPPLMSDDTFSALLEQMQEGGTQGSASMSFSLQSNSNTDLLSKAMRFAEIRPGESNFPPDTSVQRQHSEVTSGPGPGPSADSESCSLQSPQGQPHAQDTEWSREKDKLILEMVRDYGDSEDTYTQIAARLQHTTPQQVSERLLTLMEQLGSSEEETDGEDFADV